MRRFRAGVLSTPEDRELRQTLARRQEAEDERLFFLGRRYSPIVCLLDRLVKRRCRAVLATWVDFDSGVKFELDDYPSDLD